MRNKIGTSPDELRRRISTLDRAVSSLVTTASSSVVTGWTDNLARWVSIPVAFTDFVAASTTVDTTMANLPAGFHWTAVWIEPGTLFSGGAVTAVTLEVLTPATGTVISGVPVSVDSFGTTTISAQVYDQHVACDRSGTCDVVIRLTTTFDDADALTAGTATIRLFGSVPGSTSDSLPHS